jgi:phytoene synthase
LPSNVRPAFATLWNLDLALADIVSTTTEPALGAIRLAWWRERLEELDAAVATAPEPRLRAIARQLIGRGITGKELSRLEDGWLPLLRPFPWGEEAAEGLRSRGRVLFAIGAKLLGAEVHDAEDAGALWSLVDGANHCSDPQSRDFLMGRAQELLPQIPTKIAPALRPLTVLAALAAIDVIRAGSGLARVSAAVRHRLLGTLPRS